MATITVPVGLKYYYKWNFPPLIPNTANPGDGDLTEVPLGTPGVLVPGILGTAMNLPGPNSIFAAPVATTWLPVPSVQGELVFTVAVWFQVTTFSSQPFGRLDQVIIREAHSSADTDTRFELGVTTISQLPYFKCTQSDGNTIIVNTTALIHTDTWYFVAGWIDGPAGEMGMLNQGQVVTKPHDGTVLTTTFPTSFVGRLTNIVSGDLQGIVDDIDIWERRLSLAELEIVENGGAGQEDLFNLPNPVVIQPLPVAAEARVLALETMVDDVLSRLGDDGTLFSRAEVLHQLSLGYRRFTNQARHAKTFTALDMPPRHTRAITYEWESNSLDPNDDGGTHRKFTFTQQNRQIESTYLWEIQASDNLSPTPSRRNVTQLWELAFGEGEIDGFYRFSLPRNEAVIHGVWHDHEALDNTTVRQLDRFEDRWWAIVGEPMLYTQMLGNANDFDVYQIATAYQQAYDHRNFEHGTPRAISGARTYVIDSEAISWGYAYAWDGEPASPIQTLNTVESSGQLPGPGRRFTFGPVSDVTYDLGDGFYYTYSWEGDVHADATVTPGLFTGVAETNPARYDPSLATGVVSTTPMPFGTLRRIVSPDRQYWPSHQWQVHGTARRWGSSDSNILVYHSVNSDDLLSENEILPLIPPQSYKYLIYWAVSVLFNRQGEGADLALAGHYQQRANRGVTLLHKLGNPTRHDVEYVRGGSNPAPVRGSRLPQLPSNYPRAPWLRNQ